MTPFTGTFATALAVVAVGVGATAVHDAWTTLRRAFGVASPGRITAERVEMPARDHQPLIR